MTENITNNKESINAELVSSEIIPENETHNNLLQIHEHIPNINQNVIFEVGPFAFGSSTMTMILFVLIFSVISIFVKRYKMIPGKVQSLFELLFEFVYNFIYSIIGNREKAKKVLPYIGTIFIFILFSNLIFLIPGVFNWTINGNHLLSASTADFNTTFALALSAILLINFSSIKTNGLLSHLGHFIQISAIVKGFRKSVGDGFIGIIHFFVGIIEIIGEVAKIISLSLRLFGNIFAHEVLTVIILGALSIGLPAIWMGFGILVGVVQAIVFTALISVYYSLMHKENKEH